MNKKLIAAAVSAAVVAPVAAYGEVQVYGRINNAIDLNDIADEEDSDTDVSSVSSRFGIKYNKEIGNGLSAHGRYEFATNTDNERGINDLRIGTVGVSGPFGRIDVGNQWSAYFDTFGTLISPTYTLGYYIYSSIGGGPFRGSNTIKYSNSFGPLYAELDVRLNEGDEGSDVGEKIRGDGIGLGLSWAVTDNITIAAAFDNEDGADDISGSSGSNAIVTSDYDPGNEKRRGSQKVDVQQADGSVTETIFGAVTTADMGGGNINVATGGSRTGTTGEDGTGTKAVGRVITPAKAAVTAGDNPDTERIGIAVKATFGDYWLSVGWQNYEVDENERSGAGEIDIDTTFIYGGGKFGEKTSWLIGYSEADDEADAVADVVAVHTPTEADRVNGKLGSLATDDSTQLTWAIYHNLGGGLKLYYEATDLDIESGDKDGARHLIGMRVDF